MSAYEAQFEKMANADGFIAALDQSGGSTPKALRLYGVSDDAYTVGEESMYDKVHEMRTRIITSPSFTGDKILAAILFEMTMDREIEGKPTAQYLWEDKKVVPLLKVDKGLAAEENGVQLMKPNPGLGDLLKRAKEEKGIFGTKMRSVVKLANAEGVKAIVEQQFEVGKQIVAAGLVPIIEPEVDIHSPEKKEAEDLLKASIMDQLNKLEPDQKVMLKLSLPTVDNLYKECIEHPNCVRVVALSGGYKREEANEILARNDKMIGSFSRALTEGLNVEQSDEEYNKLLGDAIDSIYNASKA